MRLFRPGSPTWAVWSHPTLLIAGQRAAIVQMLHPPTAAGVALHSVYRADFAGRLRRGKRSGARATDVEAVAQTVRGARARGRPVVAVGEVRGDRRWYRGGPVQAPAAAGWWR
jgi:uncharacterized protein (DUF2236 family)